MWLGIRSLFARRRIATPRKLPASFAPARQIKQGEAVNMWQWSTETGGLISSRIGRSSPFTLGRRIASFWIVNFGTTATLGNSHIHGTILASALHWANERPLCRCSPVIPRLMTVP